MHLVPFGEYVPLKRLLFFVEAIAAEIGDFTPGRQVAILPLEGAPFGTVICYEVIFPDLFRRFVAEGASFMANITNDAWFGDTSGPGQHLAMLPLRAVEHRIAIARAANTGDLGVRAPVGRDPEHAPARDARDAPRRRSRSAGGTRSTRGSATASPTPAPRSRAPPSSAAWPRVAGPSAVLSELKREFADVERRLDDLRGHL